MTHDTEFWGLEYCSTCIQMTNHDDNGCLKCRAKVAMAGQELKRIMDSYHLGGYGEEYEEIIVWHQRELNEAVRDAMNDAKREIYEDCTLDEVIEAARALGIIDRRIAELEGKL